MTLLLLALLVAACADIEQAITDKTRTIEKIDFMTCLIKKRR